MKEAIATIRSIGKSFLTLADQLDHSSEPSEAPTVEAPTTIEAPSEPESPSIKVEDVRAVLSEISRAGKTTEMKSLLGKFGAAKLSEVDPKDYAALLTAAKEVKNA